MLEINYELIKEDIKKLLFEGTHLNYFKSMKSYYFFKTLRFIFITFILGIIILTIFSALSNLLNYIIPIMLLIIMAILVSDIPFNIMSNNIYNNYKKNNSINVKVQINEYGLKSESKLINYNVPWCGIRNIAKTQNNILFILSGNIMTAIPKRIFASDEEYNSIYEYILEFKNKSQNN